MTSEAAAADSLKRELGFHIRTSRGESFKYGYSEFGWLESIVVNDKDQLVATSCRPVHKPEIAMWKKLVEYRARLDDLESSA